MIKNRASSVHIIFFLTLANIIGKILGFGKDVLISYHYGASAMTDALFLAMAIPTMILGVFTSASDSAIIPQYNRILTNKGREYADLNFSNIVNILLFIGFFVSLFICFFPNLLLGFFAPGFKEKQIVYGVKFLRLFSFFGLLHIMYCFFSSYASVYNKITMRSILACTTNLFVIIALLIDPDPNMLALSWAFLLGYIIHGVLPFFYAKKIGFHYKFIFNFKSVEYIKFIHVFVPIMGSAFLLDINMFVDRFLSSSMGVGSISSLSYASRLTSIFDTMIVVGIGVVILPLMSNLNLLGDKNKFVEASSKIIRLMIILLLPIVVLSMSLSKEIISLVYMRGNFSQQSVDIVAQLFFLLSPQILFISLQAIMAKLFHSMENTRIPLYSTFLGVILNIILSLILSHFIGLNGIALATSIAMIVNFIILFVVFKIKIGWTKYLNSIYFFKLILIFLCMYFVGYILQCVKIHTDILKLAIHVLCELIVYLVLLRLFLKNDFLYLKEYGLKFVPFLNYKI